MCALLQAQQAETPRGWATLARRAMGSEFSIRLSVQGDNELAAAEAALDEVQRIDAILSTWRDDSFVSFLNRSAHLRSVRLDREVLTLLERSIELCRDTDGAFDVTVGPVVRAWGFLGGTPRLVPGNELGRLRRLVGAPRQLQLDREAATLRFARPGVELDFGAIGKGWAIDAAVGVLRSHGIANALVEGGTSTVYALGAPPHRSDGWAVAIRDPRDRDAALTTVILRDRALSVSGDYEKCFLRDGVRYGHIVDPRTCRPVSGIAMAAAVTATATASDALATAFFVLQEAGTRTYLREHPDVEATLCPTDPAGAVLAPIHFEAPRPRHDHD